MAIERYPDNATIVYVTGAATMNSIGDYTPGTSTTISVTGRIEPTSNKEGAYIISDSGDRIDYRMTMFARRFTDCDDIPVGAELYFAGEQFRVVDNTKRQTHFTLRLQ